MVDLVSKRINLDTIYFFFFTIQNNTTKSLCRSKFVRPCKYWSHLLSMSQMYNNTR